MGPWKHLDWCGTTRLGIRALKVLFSAKMPLVNLELTKSQTRSKSSQNNIFHGFTSNPSYSETFVNFDRVWLSLTCGWLSVGPKTLILIRSSEWVETSAIAEIIKFPFQQIFMGQNWS